MTRKGREKFRSITNKEGGRHGLGGRGRKMRNKNENNETEHEIA